MVSTSFLTLYVLPRRGAERAQTRSSSWLPLVGFVVGKKVSKSACRRNLAKRRMREAYRFLRSGGAIEKPESASREEMLLDQWYALVFVAHAGIDKANYCDVEKEIGSCLRRINRKFGRGQDRRQVSKSDHQVNTGDRLLRERDNN